METTTSVRKIDLAGWILVAFMVGLCVGAVIMENLAENRLMRKIHEGTANIVVVEQDPPKPKLRIEYIKD